MWNLGKTEQGLVVAAMGTKEVTKMVEQASCGWVTQMRKINVIDKKKKFVDILQWYSEAIGRLKQVSNII